MGWDSSLDPTTAPRSVLMARSAAAVRLEGDGQSAGQPKKVHWTQTPKGKKIMAKRARASHKARKAAKRNGSSQEAQADHSNHIAYIFGKVESLIEHYSASAGVPRSAIASGVAELLRHKEGGSLLGTKH